jgi:predicted dienelactone hydrolase
VGGPADPSAPGPYTTTQVTINVTTAGQSSTIDVRMPQAPLAARPLVVINHGWMTTTALYTQIADHLASRGFVAALFQQPVISSTSTPDWSTQLRCAIDALLAANAPGGALAGAIDTTKIGVMGHSYGGATVIYATGDDPRIKACVALAPVNQYWAAQIEGQAAKITVPFLVEAAQNDNLAIPASYTRPFFQAATQAPSKLYIELAGADHMVFCDTEAGTAGFTLGIQFSTAWFEHFLGGNPDPAGWTDGTMGRQDLKAGSLDFVE